ncbi:MAG: hybrid sensor histidine kinase/response regulator [Anaerolineae bacterium]|nr:hybrid sensor histidine kinase/response regulator [Anaerolineae bacterium]
MSSRELVTDDNLNYLRAESLRPVLFCIGAVLYIWYLVLFQPANTFPVDRVGAAAWGPIFLGIGVGLAFVFQKRSSSAAAALAIAGTAAAVFSTMWVTGARVAPYMFAVVVSLAGLLFGMKMVVVATVLCSVAVIVVGSLRWGYLPISGEVLSPVLAIGVVGILSLLSVRNLYMALHWALDRAMAAQRNEEEARIHRGELARTLKALTDAYQRLEYANYDLARAREAADEARLNKQRFVASVSHEMRTPLNVLTALGEMMYFSPERYGDQPLPPDLRRDAREIYRSSKHLISLIDDVLDMAKIEAGQMRVDFEPISLNVLVTETLDMIHPLVREKGIALRAELPRALPLVLIDQDRVQQVLLNLLNNAQRYTENGSITVRVVPDSEQIQVTVADTGVGIPPGEIEDMFKEFHQVEGLVAQGRGGHGLGLAICKRFIEMHGGRIWVESDGVPGHGSQFHFTLPVVGAERAEVSTLQETQKPLRSPSGRGRTLLLLDHDSAAQKMLEQGLEEYRVVPVEDVSQVPRLIDELRAQAMVVNSAHEEQAKERLLALRRQLGHFSFPIILCPLVGRRQLGQALGVVDYLVKPITREALVDLLDRLGDHVNRILVVDDDSQMVRILLRMIGTAGRDYEVTCAYNGRDGLREILSQRPDLVLLDLVMPEMDGYEVLTQIREDAELSDLPVVIITAQAPTSEEERQVSKQPLLISTEAGFTHEEILAYLRGILSATDTLSRSYVTPDSLSSASKRSA